MAFLPVIALVLYLIRTIITAAVVVIVVLLLLDWLVRTRRIQPFHPIARTVRRIVDPLIEPLERQIVRAGGMPSQAPIWGIVGAIFLGIIIVAAVNFIGQTIVEAMFALAAGLADCSYCSSARRSPCCSSRSSWL